MHALTKVEVMGLPFNVKREPPDDEGNWGECDLRTLTIKIHPELVMYAAYVTLWHEIIEAISALCRLGLTDDQIDLLAHVIAGIMIRYPEIAKPECMDL